LLLCLPPGARVGRFDFGSLRTLLCSFLLARSLGAYAYG
jgi:hypothetical protein